jgi:DNA modification methylase
VTALQPSGYTPELADLMEHEKVIEQGLQTFREVGWALLQIRDGKKYRAAGYDTFEAYCFSRWSIGGRQARNLMAAAEVVGELESGTTVPLLPTHESQVRPLTSLPTSEDRADAWNEAVEEAQAEGQDQPTAKQVEKAAAKRKPPKKDHPAPFSDPILDQVAAHLRETGTGGTVLDPFAGTGRVHELRDRVDVDTIGVELEPEWAAKHPDTIEGNALTLTQTVAPGSVDAIATSPTYGNRMADHHDATDDSVRLTYKHTLGRDLHTDNSGQLQWGDEYRRFHELAWAESVAALRVGGTLTINIKNHIRDGEIQRVAEWHFDTLYSLGLRLVALDVVPTKGLMAGSNAAERTPVEFVATFRKADR